MIEVVRFSPSDARQLRHVRPALCGISKGHFGAFFDRPGRERDYLLGRLDGAERLIGILLSEKASDQELAEWCRQAFAAIVTRSREPWPMRRSCWPTCDDCVSHFLQRCDRVLARNTMRRTSAPSSAAFP